MTHKEKITICEKMNRNKIKIQQFEEEICRNKSEGFGYMNGTYESAITILKRENEEYLSSLEARLNTEEFGSVYEQTLIKQPFIEKYLVPLLFAEGILTVFFIYLWRH